MLENEVAGVMFPACSPEHGWARKNMSSLIQKTSTAVASLGSGWTLSVNLSILLLMLCCVWFFSNPLQTQTRLLICYSKYARCYRVIIVWVICSCALPRLASVCSSLSAAHWNRHGREYQTGGKKQTHKSSCSSLTSRWAQPGAWASVSQIRINNTV